jgi:hypothetical protein
MDILALLKFDIEEKIVMVNYMKIYGISRRIVGGGGGGGGHFGILLVRITQLLIHYFFFLIFAWSGL